MKPHYTRCASHLLFACVDVATATCSDGASGSCPNPILSDILKEKKLTSGYMGIFSSFKPQGISNKHIPKPHSNIYSQTQRAGLDERLSVTTGAKTLPFPLRKKLTFTARKICKHYTIGTGGFSYLWTSPG